MSIGVLRMVRTSAVLTGLVLACVSCSATDSTVTNSSTTNNVTLPNSGNEPAVVALRARDPSAPSSERTLLPGTIGELAVNSLVVVPVSKAYAAARWTAEEATQQENALRTCLTDLIAAPSSATSSLRAMRDDLARRRAETVTAVTAELLAIGKDARPLSVGRAYDQIPLGKYQPVSGTETPTGPTAKVVPMPTVPIPDETKLTAEQQTLAAEIRALLQLGALALPPRDAIIDLSRSGHQVNDKLVVRVTHTLATPNPQDPAKPKQALIREDEYHTVLVRSGPYLRVAPAIVFARGQRGQRGADHETSMDWKPNVAVTAEWKWGQLDSESFLRWLDPGVGVHLAALDQSSAENAEVGAGVNCSLWGGLLQGGYGWNLMLDERREYFFVGIDLLQLFGAKTGIELGK
jgi:hypothetical protein